ncbi:MAG: acyl-[acyl-carrier-protein]--UDP-N-acetylglucosamine O-acyltransferase, partial [Chitinophagaceae bacterium]
IAHDCIVGNHVILANSVQLAGHITVGDFVFIGGTSAVHQFVHIGEHTFIAGGSLVSKDVPPYIKAVRNPLSYGGVNSVGLKRRGFTLTQINHILDIYRIIYNKGFNTSQAIDFIEEEITASDERDEILTFIRESGRGIIKRFGKNGTEDE